MPSPWGNVFGILGEGAEQRAKQQKLDEIRRQEMDWRDKEFGFRQDQFKADQAARQRDMANSEAANLIKFLSPNEPINDPNAVKTIQNSAYSGVLGQGLGEGVEGPTMGSPFYLKPGFEQRRQIQQDWQQGIEQQKRDDFMKGLPAHMQGAQYGIPDTSRPDYATQQREAAELAGEQRRFDIEDREDQQRHSMGIAQTQMGGRTDPKFAQLGKVIETLISSKPDIMTPEAEAAFSAKIDPLIQQYLTMATGGGSVQPQPQMLGPVQDEDRPMSEEYMGQIPGSLQPPPAGQGSGLSWQNIQKFLEGNFPNAGNWNPFTIKR